MVLEVDGVFGRKTQSALKAFLNCNEEKVKKKGRKQLRLDLPTFRKASITCLQRFLKQKLEKKFDGPVNGVMSAETIVVCAVYRNNNFHCT